MKTTDYGIEIVRVINPPGYKLRFPDDSGSGYGEGVIADGDETATDPEGRLDGMERLLNYIMDYFGYYGSKHDAERLRVVRERKDGVIVHFGEEYKAVVNDDDEEYVITDKGQAEIGDDEGAGYLATAKGHEMVREGQAELDALAEATKRQDG